MINVTNQDKKKARNTTLILSVILVLFTVLTVIFGVSIPKANEMKWVGDGEKIKELVEGKDGDDYFLLSESAMYRFDAFTDEHISTFNLSEITTFLENNGDQSKLLDSSLNQWRAKYIEGENGADYYFLIDGNGNIFKLKDDGVRLTLTDDYYLVDATTGKLDVNAYDVQDGQLYALMLQSDSNYYIYRFDAENLHNGVNRTKQLWSVDISGATTTAQKIVPVSSSNTSILSFVVTEDTLYLFKGDGGIIRVGLDLVDYVDQDGLEVDYMNDVKAFYEQGKDKLIEEETIHSHFKKLLLEHKDNTRSEEELSSASIAQLQSWYQDLVSTKKFNDEYKKSKDAAKAAIDATFAEEYPWCASYDGASRSVSVYTNYFDSHRYSILNSGDANIGGIVYSKKNKAVYYTNFLDGYLYCVEKSAIDGAKSGSFLSDLATQMSSVTFKEKFSSFGNALSINEFANTLYIRYDNKQIVSIVDLNDKNDYKITYTFEANFDINTLTGDKDNKVTHVLRQATSVDIHANASNSLYACTYHPEQFANKALTRTLFIASLAITVVILGVALWFFVATKNDRVLYKLKFIQKDLQRNKRIYFVLLFFIVLLFMFCYYEAIGAISMSFFNYTQAKPAWIWNNFANYIKILNDADFWRSTLNMLFFLGFDLLLCIVPPLVFAFLLILIRNKTASNWIRSLMFIPGIIPSMASMLIWRTGIYGDTGILNQLLRLMSDNPEAFEPIQFLGNVNYSRWALMMMGFPFVGGYLIFYGGMINIPEEYHEAGRLEGLGIVKRFLLIDIPLIMPQIKYIFIMTFITSVQNYARTFILASSGTKTPVELMYRAMMGGKADYGMASAYATLIFLFLFAAVATNFKMQKKDTMGEDL